MTCALVIVAVAVFALARYLESTEAAHSDPEDASDGISGFVDWVESRRRKNQSPNNT